MICKSCGRFFHEGNRHVFVRNGKEFSCAIVQNERRRPVVYLLSEEYALDLLAGTAADSFYAGKDFERQQQRDALGDDEHGRRSW